MLRLLRPWSAALMLCAAPASAGGTAIRTVPASQLQAEIADIQGNYRLGSNDRVRVTVYGEDALSGEQAVGADGTITVPLIGPVAAAGRTVAQLAAEIRTRLDDGFVRNPNVTVTILSYRPYYILGEVTHPGQYDYSKGLTVIAAIAKAEGFTYRARKSAIFLKREGQAEEVRVALTPDLLVAPGDTIRIGERYF